jgi:DNA-binding response OmpR family regulator
MYMNISIIDDEAILTSRIGKKLKLEWYTVNEHYSFQSFMDSPYVDSDLYIIDLALWDGNGFDIIQWLREEKHSFAPIIITSWFNDTEKKVYGLNIWADDYLPKPFAPDELMARIQALFRRKNQVSNNNILQYKNIIYNLSHNDIMVNGEHVPLTSKEKQIVKYFLYNQWVLVEKIKLIHSIWGCYDELNVSDNTINVTMSKIRKKLGKEFSLKTKVNQWYILET